MTGNDTWPNPLPVSCGTLIINQHGKLLLCHVTHTRKWDIPKGIQDPGETPLAAAMRELWEEAGIAFDAALYEDLGSFAYRSDKRLHLFKLAAPADLDDLGHLRCTSFFPHRKTGKPVPEVDGFRWAARGDVAVLCWPRMAKQLLALAWG
ncbi:MAG: hypothetical protein NVSMB6_25040 [Burkholderiaceae bacterium]